MTNMISMFCQLFMQIVLVHFVYSTNLSLVPVTAEDQRQSSSTFGNPRDLMKGEPLNLPSHHRHHKSSLPSHHRHHKLSLPSNHRHHKLSLPSHHRHHKLSLPSHHRHHKLSLPSHHRHHKLSLPSHHHHHKLSLPSYHRHSMFLRVLAQLHRNAEMLHLNGYSGQQNPTNGSSTIPKSSTGKGQLLNGIIGHEPRGYRIPKKARSPVNFPFKATLVIRNGLSHAYKYSTDVFIGAQTTVLSALVDATRMYIQNFGNKGNPFNMSVRWRKRLNCYVVDGSLRVRNTEQHEWTIVVEDFNKQVVYDGRCLPSNVTLRPDSTVIIAYRPYLPSRNHILKQ